MCKIDTVAHVEAMERARIFTLLNGLKHEYDPIRVRIGEESLSHLPEVLFTVTGEET